MSLSSSSQYLIQFTFIVLLQLYLQLRYYIIHTHNLCNISCIIYHLKLMNPGWSRTHSLAGNYKNPPISIFVINWGKAFKTKLWALLSKPADVQSWLSGHPLKIMAKCTRELDYDITSYERIDQSILETKTMLRIRSLRCF